MRIRDRYKRLSVWNKIGLWGSLASVVGLVVPLLWPLLIRIGGEDLPVTLSPKTMRFTGKQAFYDGTSRFSFAEHYDLTAHNRTDYPVYHVWVELKSEGLNLEDVEIKAKPKAEADGQIMLGRRTDTYGMLMKDANGLTSILIAISRMSPNETCEYAVSVKDKSKYPEGCQLTASVLRTSAQAEPVRARSDGTNGQFILPNPLPKSGVIRAMIFFQN